MEIRLATPVLQTDSIVDGEGIRRYYGLRDVIINVQGDIIRKPIHLIVDLFLMLKR